MRKPMLRSALLAALASMVLIGCAAPVEAVTTEPALQAVSTAATADESGETITVAAAPAETQRAVEGWAVLAGKEDYNDVGMSPLDSGFINFYRMRAMLEYFGWQEDHILENRDDLTQQTLGDALNWLAENADENDVVFFYVAGHGEYMHLVLEFDSLVPPAWEKIESSRRVLLLDSCRAGAYIEPLDDTRGSFIAIGGVGADELGWSGLWEEGLPILGLVFTHYFTDALVDPSADANADGKVSVSEAALLAEAQQRRYMHEVVWTVPEFAEPFDNVDDPDNPHVPVIDHLDEPVFFDLDAYAENQ